MTLLIVLVVLLLVFGGYSYGPWNGGATPGYAPFGIGGIILVIVVLWLLGVIHLGGAVN